MSDSRDVSSPSTPVPLEERDLLLLLKQCKQLIMEIPPTSLHQSAWTLDRFLLVGRVTLICIVKKSVVHYSSDIQFACNFTASAGNNTIRNLKAYNYITYEKTRCEMKKRMTHARAGILLSTPTSVECICDK